MKMSNRISSILLLGMTLATTTLASQPALNPVQPEAQASAPTESPANTTQSLPEITSPEDLNNLSPEQLAELKAAMAKELDVMVTALIAQTGRIESALEDLSLSINAGSIGKDNKKELLSQIKKIRSLVNSIKKEAFVDVDPGMILFLLAFNDRLIEHITTSIKKGLKTLPDFDIASVQTRTQEISLEEFPAKLEKNEAALMELAIASQEIGLSWFNKTMRRIGNIFVIAHHKKWDSALLKMSLTAALVTHYLTMYTKVGYSPQQRLLEEQARLTVEISNAHTESERTAKIADLTRIETLLGLACELDGANGPINADRKLALRNQLAAEGYVDSPFWFTRIFRRTFGMKPVANASGTVVNTKHIGFIGRFHSYISEVSGTFSYAYLPIIAALYGTNWASDALEWTGKQAGYIFAKLMGGTAAQKADTEIADGENQEPKYTFDDVVGFDHVKATLNKVLEYIKNPDRFDRAQIGPERGYLFTGLPGTGKSFVAEAFGGEIRKIFKETGRSKDELGFYTFDAEFINKKGIGWLLNLAKKEAPCVIFIDEIDLLCLQRGSGNNPVLLSEFLSSLSGVLSKESGKQVVMLAATNRPEHLDRALRRRGRFGKIIHFELPTVAERKAFFVKKLSPLLPDMSLINIDYLADQTEGRTYEELSAMTNSAFQTTKIAGQPLNQSDLERALDEEIRNIINKDMNVSDAEQELIATHQAGHAVARALLNARRELAAVTIKPINAELQDEAAQAQYYAPRKQKDIQYGDTFTKCSFDHLEIYTREEKIKECKILLAGMLAEKVVLGACGFSYHTNDKQEALDLVKSMVFEGLHPQTMPKELQRTYFEQALEQLKQYEQETEALLMQNKEALMAIARNLVEFKTLSAQDVKRLIERKGIAAQPAVA